MGRIGGWRGLVLIAFGLACGASLFLEGAYDESIWGPAALVILALVLVLAVATRARPTGPALVALAGLVGLWLLAYGSQVWAESIEAALSHAGRWALYAAAFAALVLLLRRPRDAGLAVAAATAGVLGIALYDLARMAVGEGAELFFLPATGAESSGARLSGPLGYVNGQAMFLLLGLWPLVAVAERRASRWSAPAFAGATAVAALIFLGQSRGAMFALAVSAAVLLALVPGRIDRLWVLLGLGLGLAVLWIPLQDVYDHSTRSGLDSTAQTGALAILGVAAAAGALWALAGRRLPVWRRLPGWPLPVAPILAVAVLVASPFLIDRADSALHGFTHLREGTESSRLLSSEGYRYDYWRVAASEFREHPIRGVGAGNYPQGYYASRRTGESITQPHSLVAQTLAELGVAGVTALIAFVGGVLWGFGRWLVRLRGAAEGRALVVAAAGMFTAWLAHTSVDWIHLIPGVTGVALLAAAVLVMPGSTPAGSGRRGWIPLVAVLAAVSFAAFETGRGVVALHERTLGEEALADDPEAALRHADRALSLRPESVLTLYVESAAHARRDDYPRARATLLEAVDKEPNNFVTWTLLGDLATRRGDAAAAQRYYRTALGLNPRDPELAVRARGTP